MLKPSLKAAGQRAARSAALLFATPVLICPLTFAGAQVRHIPTTQAVALDGHAVTLPRDLPAQVTVLILGFGRNSAQATTAWEKPTRASLAHLPEIGMFDVAMLAEVPGFVRGFVTRAIRNKVPPVLQPNFLTLTADEKAWKQAAGYDSRQPDAAYVMLVDRGGTVRWSLHEPYTPAQFALMAAQARQLSAEAR